MVWIRWSWCSSDASCRGARCIIYVYCHTWLHDTLQSIIRLDSQSLVYSYLVSRFIIFDWIAYSSIFDYRKLQWFLERTQSEPLAFVTNHLKTAINRQPFNLLSRPKINPALVFTVEGSCIRTRMCRHYSSHSIPSPVMHACIQTDADTGTHSPCRLPFPYLHRLVRYDSLFPTFVWSSGCSGMLPFQLYIHTYNHIYIYVFDWCFLCEPSDTCDCR